MRIFLASLAFISLPSLASAQLGVIQKAYNPATGHTYALLEESSWTDAEATAIQMGGHLVTVNDAAENTWGWDEFNWLGSGNLWIGLNDINQEGTFEWANGEVFNYQYWHWSEPNDLNGVEDYCCMWGWYAGNWNDFNDLPSGWGPWHGVVEIEGMYAMKPLPGASGVSNTFTVNGASPSANVTFIGSLVTSAGIGVPGCPGLFTDLGLPIQVLGTAVTDATGSASIALSVPSSMAGRTVYIQVVNLSLCEVSSLASITFS
ncbi:MAG: hypothetical protein COA70_02520 [Planctomycetota bacterium]|nr:MAG: hypothetical protein COA70_02520 [Planctomycetota bacterium]